MTPHMIRVRAQSGIGFPARWRWYDAWLVPWYVYEQPVYRVRARQKFSSTPKATD